MNISKGIKGVIVSLVAVLCVFAMSFAVALADDGYTWTGEGSDISVSGGVITIGGSGTLTISSDTEASIVVNSGTVEIVVEDGVTLTSTSDHTVYIASGAVVTLSGGTYVCTANDSANKSKGVVVNYGTCTINGGTYCNSSSANKAWYTIVNSNYGTMTINGGTFTGDASSSGSTLVRNVGVYDANSDGTYDSTTCTATLTINGGTFGDSSNNKYAVKNDLCGTLVINGGTFYGSNQSVQNWSVATINGGTFNSMVIGWSGTYTLDYNSTLTIYGGTFKDDVRAVSSYNSTSTTSTVIIYDGTFNDDVVVNIYNGSKSSTGYQTKNTDYATITIYHGEFLTDVSGFLATSEDGTIYIIDEDYDVHALVKVEATDATCTEDGNYEYYYCSYVDEDGDDCGAIFVASTDEDGNVTYVEADESDVVIEAAGEHTYELTWTWTETDDGYTATLTRTCSVCGYSDVLEAEVTSTTLDDGSIVYTAVALGELVGETYSDTLTVAVDDTVQTSDSSNIAMMGIILLMAIAGCAGVAVSKRR